MPKLKTLKQPMPLAKGRFAMRWFLQVEISGTPVRGALLGLSAQGKG